MIEVLCPLSVQPATLVPPWVVPMAYLYFTMPDSASEDAVQLADSCEVLVRYAISAPAPSLTWLIFAGGVASATVVVKAFRFTLAFTKSGLLVRSAQPDPSRLT